LVADIYSIKLKWRIYLYRWLNVHEVNDISQTTYPQQNY
jgi:hypothetical protein